MSDLLVHNLRNVLQRLRELSQPPSRLVAVSKTFPVDRIQICYAAGQIHFGENYADELSDKSKFLIEAGNYSDIRWHFIGKIQSNKIKKICSVPGLWCIETLASEKHCDMIQSAILPESKLKVFIQVNTSGEPQKGGVEPENVYKLAEHILLKCPNLELLGLMTIGSLDESVSQSLHNPDFDLLRTLRDKLNDVLNLGRCLELSMGMSSDFQTAIKYGSTNVRIGSTIFGQRSYVAKY